MCNNTHGSYECTCEESGYELIEDTCGGTSCEHNIFLFSDCSITTDIDECASNTDTCPQVCSNTEGSYICSTCGSGLQPNINRTVCEGMRMWTKG